VGGSEEHEEEVSPGAYTPHHSIHTCVGREKLSKISETICDQHTTRHNAQHTQQRETQLAAGCMGGGVIYSPVMIVMRVINITGEGEGELQFKKKKKKKSFSVLEF
jgi:hypothetical protein